MNSPPLVSVVVPAYNCAAYIGDTLTSIESQTYPNIEVTVVNDGSSDSTSAVLDTFRHIKIINQQNQGQGIARNVGAGASNGLYIAFLDGDDLWDSTIVERQVSLLNRFPEAKAVYCDYRRIDSNGKVLGRTSGLHTLRASGAIISALLQGNIIGPPGVVMMRQDAFRETGGFGETESRAAEDYLLWLKLAIAGPFIYSPETMMSYRVHKDQTTQDPAYDYKRAVGNLRAMLEIKGLIDEDAKLYAQFKLQLWKRHVTAAWAASRIGRQRESARHYLAALSTRPCKLSVLFGLSAALARCVIGTSRKC